MASYGDMFAVFIAILAINVGFTAGAGTKTKDMFAHVGTNARLPCPVNPGLCGKLHSVKWYKDTSRIYVLSHAGTIRRPEGDAKERMKVEYPTEAGQAILQIDDVHLEDEAIYKCEITYIEVKESCHEVVQIVNLTTLVKPEVVRIIGMDGAPMENGSILGPKEEGEEVDLVCEAGSGKPIPRVSWYNGTTLISRAQYTTNDLGDGVGMGSSKLQLTLTRGDLNAQFTCKVESEALDGPIMHWIKFDVHVRPTKMELSGVKNHVVQGTNVLLICDVHGARPPAKVRWTNGSVPITDETLVQTSPEDNFGITSDVRINDRDGTYTTKSQLIFQASHWENGIKIHCYAENDVTKHHYEPEMHKLIILEVRYPPVISIHPKNITVNESTELVPTNGTLLSCKYKANPQELKGALWSKDGKNLTLTDTVKYKGGTIENPPLIIYNVTREDMGDYTCWLKNEVGSEQSSDSIFLNVQYTPDVEVLMEPPTPIKALDRTNVILECNVTSGNPATLSKVRWFLDGELMKEFPECNYTSKDDSGGPFCGLDPSILSLERVDQTFAGNYTCQGENVAGWGPISEPVELIVYYPPSPAKIRYYPSKVVKGAEVNLECKVESTGRPDNVTYIWYRGSHQMTEITTSKHKIVPVGLETRSNFTCIAMNEGGQSEPATVFINVNAPPALFDRLKPYQGILYSAQQINLTCRVECFPLCNIIWKKNGRILEFNERNTLYYNKTVIHPPDLQKNIFESIESTLIWNMTARPGQKLNRTDPNSNYTCQSESNQIGPGVSSTIEIAVDYPPEDVYVSSKLINVIEGQAPNPVKCHGKGHPNLTYKWKKNATAEPKEYSEELRLGPMMRSDSGSYICEASNKHGKQNAIVYFNVQYAPECSITRTEKDGSPALLCTVQANPQEVTFFWKAMEGNETYMETNNVIQDGLKSFLILDSTVDTKRTYQCFANNSVGFSDKQPCKMEVEGILPWWKRLNQEKRIIIIAAIIAIIICILIICIVIICVCRRKRANTKLPPNQSSIVGDKIRPGVVPPVGNMQDHPHSNNADPNDKGLYENLPFHGIQNPPNKNAFYTLTAPHCKQTILPPQYSATIPHQKHAKLIPKALFQEQLAKSKSFSSKSKHKRHFQIPLQKCHSFKFQTAESYFQPIKNIHEENLMRNGYVGEYPVSGSSTGSLHVTRNHKREKPKQKTKGPLVLRHANDHFQENIQNSVQLQYPQPILPGRGAMLPHPKQNGVVQYADLDMPSSRKGSHESSSSSSSKGHNMKQKQKTEYATLKFNDIGQEIDV
ncbi:neuromusculin isoform X4 [Rhynchophorus ferrugineus]|uniref:neuromusculin isoform X4 n=1 Tax=Rhynchophorus ferrugineus TaxID=354439 RepID=UPI003FCCF2E5